MAAAPLAQVGDGGLIALVARADCDLVELEITVDGAPTEPGTGHGSLAVSLARALLELQGASLVELADRTSACEGSTIVACGAGKHGRIETLRTVCDCRESVGDGGAKVATCGAGGAH